MVFCSSLLCKRKHKTWDVTDVGDKASKARLHGRPASEKKRQARWQREHGQKEGRLLSAVGGAQTTVSGAAPWRT